MPYRSLVWQLPLTIKSDEKMKLEKIIKDVSAFCAGVVVFLLIGGVYLDLKGFEYDGQGNFVLVRPAQAAENEPIKEIPANYAFPQDHVLGSDKAPVTLYEYSSFGCFHCADFHLEVLPELVKEYVDKGQLRIVFVPLPIDKNSMDAALLAECVEEDKYFSFADVLFKKQRDWGLAFRPQKVLMQYAALSGLKNDKAAACLKDDKTAERILRDRQAGLSDLGITGTPSFVVSSKSGNELISGFRPLEDFRQIIDARLAE